MTEIIKLACPSCGAPIEIEPEDETFACEHCGTTLAVKRSGGKVALRSLEEKVEDVKEAVVAGTEKTVAASDRTTAAILLPDAKQKLSKEERSRNRIVLWFVVALLFLLAGIAPLVSGGSPVAFVIGVAGSLGFGAALHSAAREVARARTEVSRLTGIIRGGDA
jgi:predicted nucleic acid-binding Zn ribbon protein